MNAHLETRLAALATEWDHAAPPIDIAELAVGHSPLPADRDSVDLIVVEESRPGRPSVWWLAAASVVLIGTTVALVARSTGGRDGELVPDSPDSTVVESSTIESTAPDTSPSDTAVATTAPPVTVDSAVLLGEVTSHAATKLGDIESVRATATVRRMQVATSAGASASDVTTVHAITLLADGSLWAEGGVGATLTWASYDAATGMSRNSYVDQAGAVKYQEIAGWADNSTPLLIIAGFDPTMRLDAFGDDVLVEPSTSASGRSGWVVTTTHDIGGMSDTSDQQVERWFVDEATGLIIEYSRTQLSNGNVMSSDDAALTDIEIGAAMAAAFPGAFPSGVEVDRSGDPAGFVTLTVDEAHQQFGPGLVVPADLPIDARISVRTNLGLGVQGDDRTFPGIEVAFQTHRGFLRQTVTVTKWLPLDGAVPDGYVVVDGGLCPAPGGTCSAAATLDDARAAMVVEGGFVSLSVRGVEIVLDARTAADATMLADSLVALD